LVNDNVMVMTMVVLVRRGAMVTVMVATALVLASW
jgi:hypothetical protein